MIFPRLFFMDYDSFCQNGKNQDSKSKKCVFPKANCENHVFRALLRDGFVLLVLKILYFRISRGHHLSPILLFSLSRILKSTLYVD